MRREKKKAEARKKARAEGPATANLEGARTGSRKMRVLADVVRGMSVEQALTTLAFQHRAGAPILKKVIDSAVANADFRKMDLDKLVVSDVQINKAGVMRRFLPRAHGRATPIRKQLAHVHVSLAEKN
ncbi:MAG TPA: 50S ribosomal protein L22 [Myxococcota bacterium]|jgi:large subunit ribosomal protein L22